MLLLRQCLEILTSQESVAQILAQQEVVEEGMTAEEASAEVITEANRVEILVREKSVLMAKNLRKKFSDFLVLEKRNLILIQGQKEKMEIPEMIADQCHQGITWLHVLLMKAKRKNLLALVVGLKNLIQDLRTDALRVPAKKDLDLIQEDRQIPISSAIAPDQVLTDLEGQALEEDRALEVVAEIVLVEEQAEEGQVEEELAVVREMVGRNGKKSPLFGYRFLKNVKFPV